MFKRKLLHVSLIKKIFFLFFFIFQFTFLCNSESLLNNLGKDSLQILIDNYEKNIENQEAIMVLINQKINFNREIDVKLNELKKIKTDILKNINNPTINNQFDNLMDVLLKEKDELKSKNIHDVDSLTKEEYKKEQNINRDINAIKSYLSKKEGSIKFTYSGHEFYFFIADLNKQELKLHWKKDSINRHSNLNSVIDLIKKKYKQKPLLVTNAGMFEEKEIIKPLGLYVENGKELIKLNEKDPNDDNFYLMPNGVFYVDTANHAFIKETKEFKKEYALKMKSIRWATQSGPMLIKDDRIHNKFEKKSPNNKVRNGVGIINPSKIVIGYSDLVNFYVFSEIFNDFFNCKNALFLDGAISKMYLHDLRPNDVGGEFGPILSISEKNTTK